MNYTQGFNLRLLARNEGKLKSYESCSDVRAWSHISNVRAGHLREWMKSDMPISVIPFSTLTGFLRTMTCRSRRKVAPRCHPECKSKVLLESICTSCHAMRECLKLDGNFENYFVEEELETSQWPCERCLEALKSIKMFWKIIVHKIFNANVSCEEIETDCNRGDCVRSVAKAWQNEMVHQALYVKNMTPMLGRMTFPRSSSPKTEAKMEASQRSIKSWPTEQHYPKLSRTRLPIKTSESKEESRIPRAIRKKLSKGTHIEVKVMDIGCDTCFIEKDQEEIKAHIRNVQVLQDKCNLHVEELERLKRENKSLRIELENVYKSCPWKASFYCPHSHGSCTYAPKPFETALEEKCPAPVNNIDSEMIITMKQCKNENYKHVSLLQVLHKTNEPRTVDSRNRTSSKKEDPMEILTKVQNTFGAIVKREMGIANERRHRPKKQTSDIEATFYKINSSKSAPSCSTLSSRISSEYNFVPVK